MSPKAGLRSTAKILQKGDALLLADESSLTLSHGQDAEVLFFDLAP